MSDKVKQLHDYFSPDNPGLGNLDEFKSALQDSSKRRQFFDHFSTDNPGFGTYEEFEQNVLPTPTDTTVTDTSIVDPKVPIKSPSKKDDQKIEPIKQYNTDPGVYLAIAHMEKGDRASRHNNYSAHIVPVDDLELRQHLIDNYGMETGDSFTDREGKTYYTAKYPDMETGNAANELIIDRKWKMANGNVEEFVQKFTGLDPDSDEFHGYVWKVKTQIQESIDSQDIALNELMDDQNFTPWSTTHGMPPKNTEVPMETDEFIALVEKQNDVNEKIAHKKRHQANVQSVFGQNNVEDGGFPIPVTDPDVKHIMTLREELDYDTVMTKYKIAEQFMRDKWQVISNNNGGVIPGDRKEEYLSELDTFNTIKDTAVYAQASILPLINNYVTKKNKEIEIIREEELVQIDKALKEQGFAAKAGTEEANQIWAEYQARLEESQQGRAYIEGVGYVADVKENIVAGEKPKFYTDDDIMVYRMNGWTTGSPLADRAIGGIADFTTSALGVVEFITDNPISEASYNMFYNSTTSPARWLFGEENVPLARNQLGELVGISNKTDFQPLDVLDHISGITSEYAQKYRRGANAYYDNKGFYEIASTGDWTTAGHYLLGQVITQAPQIATVMYGGWALKSPKIATRLLAATAGGGKYKELKAEDMPYLETIPYVMGEAIIEYSLERFGTQRLMEGVLNNRVAREELKDAMQTPFKRWYVESAKGFGQEGTEELVAGITQPLKDALIDFGMYGDDVRLKNYVTSVLDDAPNLLETFLVGGISGGMMVGGSTIANNVVMQKEMEQLELRLEAARLEQQLFNQHDPDREQYIYEIADTVEEVRQKLGEDVETRVDLNQVDDKFVVSLVQDGETQLESVFETQEEANLFKEGLVNELMGKTKTETKQEVVDQKETDYEKMTIKQLEAVLNREKKKGEKKEDLVKEAQNLEKETQEVEDQQVEEPLTDEEAQVQFDDAVEEIQQKIKMLEAKKRKSKKDKSELESLNTQLTDLIDPTQKDQNIKNIKSTPRTLLSTPHALQQGIHSIIINNQDKPSQDADQEFKVSESVRSLYDKFKVSLAETGVVGRKMAGYFNTRSKKVRIKASKDVLTASHELTHALDQRHGIVKKILSDKKKYAKLKPLLQEQYLRWYPGAKKNHRMELQLAEGLAVLVEHYILNSSVMMTNYGDVVNEVFGKDGVLSDLKGEGQQNTFQSEINEVVAEIRKIAEKYQSLSSLEKMKQPLLSVKRSLRDKDKSSGSFWNKSEFRIFNMYEPARRWAKILGVSGTVDDPYTWSTTLQNGNTLAFNAINGNGLVILKPDGSMDQTEYSQKDIRKLLKNEKDKEDFNALLVARRYVGDYNHKLETEAAREVLNEILEEDQQSLKDEEAKLDKFVDKTNVELARLKREGKTEELKNLQEQTMEAIEQKEEQLDDIEKSIEKTELKLKETERELEKITAIVNADHGNDPKAVRDKIDAAQNTLEQEYDRFKEAIDIYDKINNDLLELSYNSGTISKQLYDDLLKKNTDGKGYYAPFYRYIYDMQRNTTTGMFPGETEQIETGTMFQARKGSEKDIIDPLVGQAMNIVQIYNNSVRNLFWKKMADLANREENEGLAARFEKDEHTPQKWEPVGDPKIVKDKETGEDKVVYEGGYYYNLADNKLSKSYIRIYRNGKPEYYRLTEEFVAMADAINNNQIEDWAQWLRVPAATFTQLTTSANPIFALGNFTIDQFSALMQTKTGYKPILDPTKYLTKYILDRFGSVDKKTMKLWEKYMTLGGDRQTLAAFHDVSLEEVDKILQGESKYRKYTKWINPKIYKDLTPFDILQMPSNMSEFASRFSEFARAKEKGLSDVEAMNLASQVTVNFAQMGAWGGKYTRAFIKSIPYFNASMQVSWKYWQTVKDNPKRVAAVGAGIMSMMGAGLGAMLNGMRSDEDREMYLGQIANLEVGELSKAIYFPYKDGLFRIRIPEQFGSLTTLVYMGIVNHYGVSKYKPSEYYEAITSFVPDQFKLVRGSDQGVKVAPLETLYSWMPQLVKPGLETLFNKRTFPELAPIVPEYLSGNTKLQYTAYTSSVARWWGEISGYSPMKTEHFIRNQFGAVGGLFLWKFQANPMYRQNKDYIMKGKRWNDFYEDKMNLKLAEEKYKSGVLASPKIQFDLALEKKLYNKMGQTLKILKNLTLEKYDDMPYKKKVLAATMFGSIPTINKKQSQFMFDLLADIKDYDFAKHSPAQNAKNVAAYMVKMKLLTVSVGKKHSLTIDKNFISNASKGKMDRLMEDSFLKTVRSVYIKNEMEAGRDRKRALNDWNDWTKSSK